MTPKRWGILALLLAVFMWGPAPVFTKLALSEIPQFSLALLRSIIATLVMVILFLPKGYFKIDKKDIGLFVLAGLFGSVFNLGFFFFGIKLTTAINSQAIFTVNPVLTAIFAYVVLKERIKPTQMIGVFIGLCGAIIVAIRSVFETGSFNTGSITGNFFIFLAAISWVFYILISKRLSKKNYSPITITAYSFLVALISFIPFAVWENTQSFSWINTVSATGIIAAFYISIFGAVVAFLAYQTGIKFTSAFAAGVVLYLTPVITTLIAAPILGEQITSPFVAGTFLIIFGSLIATQYELIIHHVKTKGKLLLSLFFEI